MAECGRLNPAPEILLGVGPPIGSPRCASAAPMLEPERSPRPAHRVIAAARRRSGALTVSESSTSLAAAAAKRPSTPSYLTAYFSGCCGGYYPLDQSFFVHAAAPSL